MQKPSQVVVGGLTWRVLWDDGAANDNDNFGQTAHLSLTIRIGKDYAEQKQKQTLFHEIIHAIDYTYRTSKQCLSEEQVKFYGMTLYDTLRRNPEIARMLLSEDTSFPSGKDT